jgi:hypothetical protein
VSNIDNPQNPELPDDPQQTLEHIREKMESVAADFSSGRINRAQFNAIYAHYSDQRTIIERLLQRNPDNDAWRQAAMPGHTGFLREHFEAQPIFYVVFRHHQRYPLITGGEQPPRAREHIAKILKGLWNAEESPREGLARKEMGGGHWLVMAVGEYSLTVVIYSLQPALVQNNLVRDLHADFERANKISLERNLAPERMVFPQRSLIS